MPKLILITGCSGGGKSTLLAALSQMGYSTVEEPGRRILAEEKTKTGDALPWVNMEAFAHRAINMARKDILKAKKKSGFVFFDRGLIDAAVALQNTSGVPITKTLGDKMHYAKTVFLAPPWPEIFTQDEDRRHDLSAAIDEFERLRETLQSLDYKTCTLPKITVQGRLDFVRSEIKNL